MQAGHKDNRIPLELLAPAKDAECGRAAIDHGADAVYIGAERFGARAAAGNSIDDIAGLCEYAHTFGARVYVTVNTIIYDDETTETEKLVNSLYNAGVDAILVQDMGILEMNLPPIELHASTQTDNRSAGKVAWLAGHGFKRVVLARELSFDEIRNIHDAVPGVELEAFVHGALCVSYSGLCYASQYCFNRSANRGECAQFCRLKFDLEDANGRTIVRGRHLLSLKDMCRADYIGQLAEAGVTSFKIEGRLKDITYVKNVTAAYSQRLDELVARNPERYRRASRGKCSYTFTPCLDKTFNRGFTDYFINGRRDDIASFLTPKAMGEHVGHVKETHANWFTVAGTASFANGDGLCFIGSDGELTGFRVNRAEGNKIFPLKMPQGLKRGTELYRNNDQAFEKELSHKSAERKIDVNMTLEDKGAGFSLTISTVDGVCATVDTETEKQEAIKPQRDNIIKQLSKLGNTPFKCAGVVFSPDTFNFFIPSSTLADMRRAATDQLAERLRSAMRVGTAGAQSQTERLEAATYPKELSYQYNVSNKLARRFYDKEGLAGIRPAVEREKPDDLQIMQCRHCIRYSLGHCTKHGGKPAAWREPLYLRMADGRSFRLQFDCKKCEMKIFVDTRHDKDTNNQTKGPNSR